MRLENLEAQTQQFVISLKELNTHFDSDPVKLQDILFKFIELANADNFIHENEVLLVEKAIEVWKLEGGVRQDEKDCLVYDQKN
ncbi:MAG: hypothetical protein HOE30_07780 [Deltaproteobacteria bacterium]|nr:hypothetical protein [Deltaproteobacteria bacterium]